MNALARAKIDQLKYRGDILGAALAHFGARSDAKANELLAAAVDFAYTDDLLFEEFEIWSEKRKRRSSPFSTQAFHGRRDQKPLSPKALDLTGNVHEIEKIKQSAEEEAGRGFAKRLRELAAARGLDTNDKIGAFLGVTGERARVLLAGRHKPQLKTLHSVSKRFEVPLESLFGEE